MDNACGLAFSNLAHVIDPKMPLHARCLTHLPVDSHVQQFLQFQWPHVVPVVFGVKSSMASAEGEADPLAWQAALDALVPPEDHPVPVDGGGGAAAIEQVDLDVDALGELAAPLAPPRRSAAHMAKMRDRLAQRRQETLKRKLAEAEKDATANLQAISMLSPRAAKAAGVDTRKIFKKGKDVSDRTAIGMLRAALLAPQTLALEKRPLFAKQVQATVMQLCQHRQAQAVSMLSAVATHLKEEGFIVAIGIAWEQDAAKIGLKSLGAQFLSQCLNCSVETAAAMEKQIQRGSCFQHTLSENVINMSGKVILQAVRGQERWERHFHWFQAPMAVHLVY